jgi:hypothetical protein
MKLITEEVSRVKFIVEGKGAKKKMYIEGVFLQGEIKNRNGRMYPLQTLAKEVGRYNESFVSKGRALGELGHPDGPTVNLDRVSHMVTKLKKEGDNFIGEAKIMDTPMGKIVKNIMDEGGKLGVSSRGMGSLEQKNGANYVKKDFMLASAADIVADPSAPNAFVQGIMEGKEWVWDNGLLKEVELQGIVEDIETNVRKKMPNVEALAFAKFLKKL